MKPLCLTLIIDRLATGKSRNYLLVLPVWLFVGIEAPMTNNKIFTPSSKHMYMFWSDWKSLGTFTCIHVSWEHYEDYWSGHVALLGFHFMWF